MINVRIRIGGLLRCCLAAAHEHAQVATEMPKEGDTLTCHYCNSPHGPMIYRDHAWEWSQRKEHG